MKYLFVVSTLLYSLVISSQEKAVQTIKLTQLIQSLEERYNIRFSYNSDLLTEELIQFSDTSNLDIAINTITNASDFFVEKADNRYYLLRPKTAPGKVTLCGTIMDKFLQSPIEGATINNITTSSQVISDINGYFEIYLAEEQDQITINALGFEYKTMLAGTLKSPSCPTIELIELAGQYLDEIFITNYLDNSKFKSGKKGEFYFDPNKVGALPNLAEPDVLESLKVLPGIQSIAESAAKLLIRGGNPDENLILWDGIRMYDTGHLFGTLSSYNPYITDEVKLHRGGTNPKFGNVTSGIIQINSPSKIPQKISGNSGISLNLVDASLRIPIAKKIGVFASVRRSYLDIFDTGILRKYQERVFQNNTISQESQLGVSEVISNNTDFGFLDATFKTLFEINPNNKISVSLIHSNDKAIYRNQIFGLTPTQIPGTNEITTLGNIEARIEKNNYGAGLSWKNKIGKHLSYHINSYYTLYEEFSQEDNLNDQIVNDVIFGDTNRLTNELKDLGILAEIDWHITKNWTLSGGYDFSNVQITSENSIGSRQIRNEPTDFTIINSRSNFNDSQAFFYNLQFKISNKLFGMVGARHANFSIANEENWIPEPRALLRFNVNNHLKLRATFEQKRQVLTQNNDTYNEIELNRNLWSLETDSAVRTSELISFGSIYQNKSWAFDLDFYLRETENLSGKIEGLGRFVTPNDLGTGTAFGVDFLAKKSIKNYAIILSYSWLDQTLNFPESNQGLDFVGSFDITNSFSVTNSLTIKNLDLALSWRYRSGIPFSDNVTLVDNNNPRGTIFVQDFNNNRLEDFHKLDMNISYNFQPFSDKGAKFKVGVSFLNLYNRKNEIGILYQPRVLSENIDTGTRTFFIENTPVTSLGFTPNVSLRVLF